jgi:hypothetical protein
MIKRPVTRVNPNLLLFDTAAFRGAGSYRSGFPFSRPRPRGEPWRLRAQGREGYVQARTVGVSTLGVDRAVAYKAEAY